MVRILDGELSVRIAFQEKDMIGVSLSDGGDNAVIKGQKTSPFRISRLVHWIVASDPWVATVSFRNVLPHVHSTILEMQMIPECSIASRVVGMPVLVLTTWESM